MTGLTNGHQPSFATAQDAGHPSGDIETVEGSAIHPKHSHLNSLIHSGIVTHLVHVDAVPDPVYALAQMEKMPEVRSAAVFEDGLIALGCPDGLPTALAQIAVPAVPTTQTRVTGFNGLQRIEDISDRLESLVDTMAPEEVILNDQLGRSILDRLAVLEGKFDATQVSDAPVAQLQDQVSALKTQIDTITQPLQSLQSLETAQSTSQAALEALAKRVLDIQQVVINQPTTEQSAGLEKSIKALSKSAEAAQSTQKHLQQLTERVEQLAASQRTAFVRMETATAKAVSGLEPALDHLNARSADTENMLANWRSDLMALAKRTDAIAESTSPIPAVLATLQNRVTQIAERPDPVLDLSGQEEGFARFTEQLDTALERIDGVAMRSDETASKVVARADETMAALQSLPSILGASLKHDTNLIEIKKVLGTLKSDLSALPEHKNLVAVSTKISRLLADLATLKDAQSTGLEGVQGSQVTMAAQIEGIDRALSSLSAKEVDFEPIQETLGALQQQLGAADTTRQSQIDAVQDTLASLAQHLGMKLRQPAQVLAAEPLVPGTSLNTLRMEFADLIAKRMKDNETPIFTKSKEA